MKISNKVKCNIASALTILSCLTVIARILDPLMNRLPINEWHWMHIIGSIIITICLFSIFLKYRKRIKNEHLQNERAK